MERAFFCSIFQFFGIPFHLDTSGLKPAIVSPSYWKRLKSSRPVSRQAKTIRR